MRTQTIACYIDVENILYDQEPPPGCACADDLRDLVGSFRGEGQVVQVVAVGNRPLMRRLVPALADERIRGYVHPGGPDAADRELIARLRSDVPGRIDTVFICSGDHAFAPVARDLRAAGKRVVVCSRAGRLSGLLAREADEIRTIGEPRARREAG